MNDLHGAHEAIDALAEYVAYIGYAPLYDLVSGGGLFVTDWRRARSVLATLPEEPRRAVALLACDQPVARESCSGELRTLVDMLVAARLAEDAGGSVRLNDLVVVPVLQGHLLTGTPPTWRARNTRTGRAYLGEDSLRLARTLPNCKGKRVLDVGTGCGIQGLLATPGAGARVLTDLEERSVELARLNARLNRIAEVEVRAGNGYEPVRGERYDLIVSLPPYVPALGPHDDTVYAGGQDGMRMLRELIRSAGDHLSPGGELIAFAQLLCNDNETLIAAELADLAGHGVTTDLVAGDWHPLHPFATELAGRLAASAGADVGPLCAALLESLRGIGATGVCTAIVRVRKESPAQPDRPSWGRMLARRRPTDIPQPVPDLCFGEDRSLRAVSSPRAGVHVLRGPVAALLAACDGHRDIATAAETAWGHPTGAADADLLDEALARIDELEGLGLLTLR